MPAVSRTSGVPEIDDYSQCHFFAGIGGWSYALELAGWPADRPVWTGSCPCQPFSAAGKGRGEADERHLWPEMLRLVAECRPPVVFGEQVSGAAGRAWLAGVRRDLEAIGYAVGTADLRAAGVGSPHIRQRLYGVADDNEHADTRDNGPRGRRQGRNERLRCDEKNPKERSRHFHELVAMGFTEEVSSYPEARRILDGIPGRVGLLRGLGNAIVPQVAAQFVGAFLDVKGW